MRLEEIEEYYRYERSNLARLILPPTYAKVLEVGCGAGAFSVHYAPSAECWGVEPYEVAAQIARDKFFKVLNGLYRDVEGDIPDGYFDLVVCNDVIEHMPDADAFLKDIRQKMKPGGLLVGSIPNVRYYRNLFNLIVKKDWKYADGGILDRTHQRFFTKRSLRRSFLYAGLNIELLRGYNSEFSFGSSSKIRYLMRSLPVLLLMALGHGDTRFYQFAFRVKVSRGGKP